MKIMNPSEVVDRGIVSVLDKKIQVQQTGLDVTVKEIYALDGEAVIDFDNSQRKLPNYIPLSWGDENKIHLKPGSYKVILNELFKMPTNANGICFPRSSLTRSGGTIMTALWDPGYVGRSEILLVIFNPAGITITKNARVGQFVLYVEDTTFEEYKGIYQKQNLQ